MGLQDENGNGQVRMKLTIGEHAGFCFGVRRAVLKAFECAEKQLPCVTLGPLIHNPQEVERLRQAGIRSVDSLDEVASGETVIIRSHGVTPEVYAQCEARGIPVIDATCPHVAHIHQLVQTYSEDGSAVVIVGEADHPEVVGIAGLGAWRSVHFARCACRGGSGFARARDGRCADDDSARPV